MPFFCWLLAHDERFRVAMKGNDSGVRGPLIICRRVVYILYWYTRQQEMWQIRAESEPTAADAEPPPIWLLAVAEGSMRAWQRSETSALTCYAIKGGQRRRRHRRRRRSRNEIRVYSSIYAECLILRSPSANDFSPDITARSWMAFSSFFLSFSFPAPLPLSLLSFDDDDDDYYWATGQSLLFSVI